MSTPNDGLQNGQPEADSFAAAENSPQTHDRLPVPDADAAPIEAASTRSGSELSRHLVDATFADLIAQNYPDEAPRLRQPGSQAQQTAGQASQPAGQAIWVLSPAPVETRYSAPARPSAPPTARRYGPRDWPASDAVIALEEAETHFQPPTPHRKMATTDPVRRLAAVMAVGAPILAILALIFHAQLGVVATWITAFAAIDFLVSIAVLLWRMPAKREDRMDDGAVVWATKREERTAHSILLRSKYC